MAEQGEKVRVLRSRFALADYALLCLPVLAAVSVIEFALGVGIFAGMRGGWVSLFCCSLCQAKVLCTYIACRCPGRAWRPPLDLLFHVS